jgi:hypothetical protein
VRRGRWDPVHDHVLVPVLDPEDGPNRDPVVRIVDPVVDHVQSQDLDRGLEIEDALIKDEEGQDPDRNLGHQSQSTLRYVFLYIKIDILFLCV